MKYGIVLYAFLLTVGISYGQNEPASTKLNKIRELVNSKPEEAKGLILEVLSAKKLHDTILCDTYLAYGSYYNGKGDIDSSLHYYEKSIPYADKHPERRVQAMTSLAAAYRKKNDFSKAEQILDEAEKISRDNNDVLLGRVYGAKGSVYNMMLEDEKAFIFLKKAIDILKRDRDSLVLVATQSNLAGNYMKQRNFEFAIDMYEEVMAGAKRNKDFQNYYIALLNYADCHIYTEKPKIAVRALQEAVTGFTELGNQEMLTYVFWKLAKATALDENWTKAQNYYEKAQNQALKNNSGRLVNISAEYIKLLLDRNTLDQIPTIIQRVERSPLKAVANLEDQMYYEQQRATYYEGSSQTGKALEVLKIAMVLKDSIESTRANSEIHKLQAEYQNELQLQKNRELQKDNVYLQEKTAAANKIYWLSAGVAVLVILGGTVLIYLLRYRNRLQRERIEKVEAEQCYIIEKHKNEEQRNQLLQNDLALKEAALQVAESRVRNFLVDVERKNAEIDMYVQQLELLRNTDAEEGLITQHKKELDALLTKAIITDEKWDAFIKLFHQVHPDYIVKLSAKLPGLTAAEMRYVTMRKLRLSSREIALALGIQPDTIRLYKHRLRKKYNFENDNELNAVLDF